jgi:HCOMODA/2-hydroxy-3-carboxy-muconic semialdehyde decarboxylase
MSPDADLSLLSVDEISARQVSSGRVFERLWQQLTHGDAEAPSVEEAFAAS